MKVIEAASLFNAISQPNRLGLLQLLISEGPDGLTAGTLATRLGISPSTLTFHAKELTATGLISAKRKGRHVHYSADYNRIGAMINFLIADCCQGDPRVCAPILSGLEERGARPKAVGANSR